MNMSHLKTAHESLLRELEQTFSKKKESKQELPATINLTPSLNQVEREKVKGRWGKVLSSTRVAAGVTAAIILSPVVIPMTILLVPPLALVGAGIGTIAGGIGSLVTNSPMAVSEIIAEGALLGGVTGALPLFATAGVSIAIAGKPKGLLKVIVDEFIPLPSFLKSKKSDNH